MPGPCTSPRPGRLTRSSPPTWASTGPPCVSECRVTGNGRGVAAVAPSAAGTAAGRARSPAGTRGRPGRARTGSGPSGSAKSTASPGGAYGSPRVTAELREGACGSTRSGSPALCGRSLSLASACVDASAPPSRTRQPHRFRTCSSGTSPSPIRGGNTWATSRISRSRAGVPPSRDRTGVPQPQGRRLVHRRPHAHQPGRRLTADGGLDPWRAADAVDIWSIAVPR